MRDRFRIVRRGRARVDGEVRSFIEAGVPRGFADKVASLVRPCVAADSERCDEATVPVGASKFGGRPDVPAGFEWPMAGQNPCWFVAQVRLADLGPFDTGYQLSRAGLLSFFYHDDDGAAGRKPRVLVLPGSRLRRTDIVPDERYGGREFHEEHFPARTLRFSQGYSLPADPGRFRLTPQERRRWERSAVFDFKAAFNERFAAGAHQLFGHPTYTAPPRGHELVAKFGLVGDEYVYFVPEGRVAALDFAKVRVIYECS